MSYPFAFTRPAAQHWLDRVLDHAPLVLLIAWHDGVLHTLHVPVVRDADGGLFGHLARVNPLAALPDGQRVRLVALGPHAYVSPRDYAEPSGQVPTWNYAAAYLDGALHWVDQPDEVFALIGAQTRAFEGDAGWVLDDQPAYRAMLRGIRAFRFTPQRSDVAVKMSQNKSDADAASVAARLEASGQNVAAAWLRMARE